MTPVFGIALYYFLATNIFQLTFFDEHFSTNWVTTKLFRRTAVLQLLCRHPGSAWFCRNSESQKLLTVWVLGNRGQIHVKSPYFFKHGCHVSWYSTQISIWLFWFILVFAHNMSSCFEISDFDYEINILSCNSWAIFWYKHYYSNNYMKYISKKFVRVCVCACIWCI